MVTTTSEAFYHGTPGYPGKVTVVEEDGTKHPLKHHVRHSPDGFSWGYGGSGPAELARCLLLDAVNDDAGYQQFKFEVVAHWPQDEVFTYPRKLVVLWSENHRG